MTTDHEELEPEWICPDCGQTEALIVYASVAVEVDSQWDTTLYPSYDHTSEYDLDADSYCDCPKCGWYGQLRETRP